MEVEVLRLLVVDFGTDADADADVVSCASDWFFIDVVVDVDVEDTEVVEETGKKTISIT